MTDRERIAEIIGKYHIGCNLQKECGTECNLCAADALIEAGYTCQPKPSGADALVRELKAIWNDADDIRTLERMLGNYIKKL